MEEKAFQVIKPQDDMATSGVKVSHREHKHNRNPSDSTNGATLSTIETYREGGALINRGPTGDLKKEANAGLKWNHIRRRLREPLSEFMGVYVFSTD